MVLLVALLALGGCKAQDNWQHCTAFHVVDEGTGENVQSISGRPIDSTILRYRVVSENPVGVEVYWSTKMESGRTAQETRVIVLKPGQNVQCIDVR